MHYNVHPSGIELKHIVRHLNFNLGSALKYVVRRHGKEYERSLKSALFYLHDHLENKPASQRPPDAVLGYLRRYAESEPEPLVSEFYTDLRSYLAMESAQGLKGVIADVDAILLMRV